VWMKREAGWKPRYLCWNVGNGGGIQLRFSHATNTKGYVAVRTFECFLKPR
jgi:hypothetical protein